MDTRTQPLPRATGPRSLLAILIAAACTAAVLVGVPTTAANAARGKPAPIERVVIKDVRGGGKTVSVKVKWSKAKGASRYEVRWGRTAKMKKSHRATTRKRSLRVRGLKKGATWCFQVRGLSGKKKGKRSAPVCQRTTKGSKGKPGAAAPPRAVAQHVAPGGTVMTIAWPRIAGASSYEVFYEITPRPAKDQQLKSPRTLKVPSSGSGGEQLASIAGLSPGAMYCFQVQGIGASKGPRGPRHCKLAMPANRAALSHAVGVSVGTWNVCGPACQAQRPWASRVAGIAQRIDGSGLDAVAVQETALADVRQLDAHLPRFDIACTSGNSAQAVLVSRDRFEIVGTPGQRGFGQQSHGACWNTVRDRISGKQIVLASLHLPNDGAGASSADRGRYAESLASTLRGPGLPVVMAGDFNSSRGDDMEGVDGPRVALAPLGFDDAYDVAASFLSHNHLTSANGWRTKPDSATLLGTHIDRVFPSPGIHVASWQVVEPIGPGGYTQLLSNHSLVRVVLHLPA